MVFVPQTPREGRRPQYGWLVLVLAVLLFAAGYYLFLMKSQGSRVAPPPGQNSPRGMLRPVSLPVHLA